MIKRDEDWIILEEIANIKWRNGFECGCGCTVTIKAKKELNKRCAQCKTEQSPTAGTVFDRLRMPISFAAFIIKEIAEGENKPQSMEISNFITQFGKNSIRQKTIWDFMLKVYRSVPTEPFVFDDGLFIKYRLGEVPIIIGIGHVGKSLKNYAQILPNENNECFIDIIYKLTTDTAVVKAYEIVREGISLSKSKIEVPDRGFTNRLAIEGEWMIKSLDNWFKDAKTSSKNSATIKAYLNTFIYRSNGNKHKQLLEHVIRNYKN